MALTPYFTFADWYTETGSFDNTLKEGLSSYTKIMLVFLILLTYPDFEATRNMEDIREDIERYRLERI